jgi:hypothetical protein
MIDNKKYYNVEISSLHISAKPGAPIGLAISEAIIIAIENWSNAILSHDDKKYEIIVNDIIAQAKLIN